MNFTKKIFVKTKKNSPKDYFQPVSEIIYIILLGLMTHSGTTASGSFHQGLIVCYVSLYCGE